MCVCVCETERCNVTVSVITVKEKRGSDWLTTDSVKALLACAAPIFGTESCSLAFKQNKDCV